MVAPSSILRSKATAMTSNRNRLATTSRITSPRTTQRKVSSPRGRRVQVDVRRVRFPSCDSRLVREYVAPMSVADVAARQQEEDTAAGSSWGPVELKEQSRLTHCLGVFLRRNASCSTGTCKLNSFPGGAAHAAAANRRGRRRAQQQRRMSACSLLVRVVSDSAQDVTSPATATPAVLPLDLLVATGPVHNNNFDYRDDCVPLDSTTKRDALGRCQQPGEQLNDDSAAEQDNQSKKDACGIEEWRYEYGHSRTEAPLPLTC
jgi:hypothetical protein